MCRNLELFLSGASKLCYVRRHILKFVLVCAMYPSCVLRAVRGK